MRIDGVRKRGRTILIRGSFQPEDLRRVLDMANAGMLTSGLTTPPAVTPAAVGFAAPNVDDGAAIGEQACQMN